MTELDWTLIIGYSRHEAEEYLVEEGVDYTIIPTAPPGESWDRITEGRYSEDVRVVGVRSRNGQVEVICATLDWSIQDVRRK